MDTTTVATEIPADLAALLTRMARAEDRSGLNTLKIMRPLSQHKPRLRHLMRRRWRWIRCLGVTDIWRVDVTRVASQQTAGLSGEARQQIGKAIKTSLIPDPKWALMPLSGPLRGTWQISRR